MLIDMYSLVESVSASALVIWGLALLLNKRVIQSFFDSFTNIEKNETLNYLTAGMFLILGLIIIWVHNDWYWSFSVIVSLLGWILAIKASLWLLFPLVLARWAKKSAFFALKAWFRFVSGFVIIILGLLILADKIMALFRWA